MTKREDAIKDFGWAAKPRDPKMFLEGKKNFKEPVPQKVDSISLPDTNLAKKIFDYAQSELNAATFNHSMRVYYYGMITGKRSWADTPF